MLLVRPCIRCRYSASDRRLADRWFQKIKNQHFERYSFNSNAGDFGFEAIR